MLNCNYKCLRKQVVCMQSPSSQFRHEYFRITCHVQSQACRQYINFVIQLAIIVTVTVYSFRDQEFIMQPSIPPVGRHLSFSTSQVDLTHNDDLLSQLVT